MVLLRTTFQSGAGEPGAILKTSHGHYSAVAPGSPRAAAVTTIGRLLAFDGRRNRARCPCHPTVPLDKRQVHGGLRPLVSST